MTNAGTQDRAHRRVFRIRIFYVVPGYARSQDSAERRYRCTYEVQASSVQEARQQAIEQFKTTQLLSWVGWEREIVQIEHLPRAS